MLSIAICTYNRAPLLRDMLRSLRAQAFDAPYEVLVVDNRSTDDTRVAAQAFPELPIRYLFEPAQGLSYARNRALKEFVGQQLLFIDDDIRLEPGFLAAYRAAFDAFPEARYFGGRLQPEWPGETPVWARSKLALIEGMLGWYDLGVDARLLDDADFGPFGANFAIRRSLVEQVGVFDVELGCKGGRCGRGEETDWFLRANSLGARGAYVGGALGHHRIDPARMRLRRLFDYGVESGAAHRQILGVGRGGSVLRLASFAVRGAAQFLRGRGDRFRQCVINMGIEYDALRH